MSNVCKKARVRTRVNRDIVVFLGRVPAVSRNYRILSDNKGHLHIERDFDYDPGVWHREGTVVGKVEDWPEILKCHCLGGDGLVYIR